MLFKWKKKRCCCLSEVRMSWPVLLILWVRGLLHLDLSPSPWLVLEHVLPGFFDSVHSWFLHWLLATPSWAWFSPSAKTLHCEIHSGVALCSSSFSEHTSPGGCRGTQLTLVTMHEPTAPYSISPKTLGPISALGLGRPTLKVSQRHFKSRRFQTETCLSSSQYLVLFLCFRLRGEIQDRVVLTESKKHQMQHGPYRKSVNHCTLLAAQQTLREWGSWAWGSLLQNPRFSWVIMVRVLSL